MSIKNDLIKHKILIQKFAVRQSEIFTKSFKGLMQVDKQSLNEGFNNILTDTYQHFTIFANYESKFYANILSRYLDKQINRVIIEREDILSIPLPLALKSDVKTLQESFIIFKDKKIVQIFREDNPENLKNLFDGMFTMQSKSMITTAINAITGNVRLKY